MPSYKLYYFLGRGRAEVARLIFALADVPYEDIRLSGEEWLKFKSETPNGQMPVLEIDGKKFAQSNAINSYLAETYGYLGKSSMDRLLINGMMQTAEEQWKDFPFGEKDEKVQAEKTNEVVNGKIRPFLKKLEDDIIARNGGDGFFLNDVTIADLSILCTYDFLMQLYSDLFDATPKLKALVDRTRNIPNIKKWMDKRPESDFVLSIKIPKK